MHQPRSPTGEQALAQITTRAAKGEPLTFKEVDDNFLALNAAFQWSYQPIASVFLIPNAPANGDLIEISDSTGIEGLLITQGMPTGFVGSSELRVRLRYSSAASKWIWLDYAAKDPDYRYPRYRNWLINGAMAVNQRALGVSTPQSFSSAIAYCVDCWYGYSTGGTATGQQVKDATTGLYSYVFTGGSGVTAVGFGQRIESANCAALAGSTATLGVDLANSSLGSVTWSAYRANSSGLFGTNAAPTRTLFATGTFTVTPVLSRYTATFSVPAAANTGIEIVFSVGAQAAGSTWTIANAQIEPGPRATPFERKGFEEELHACQRYYQTGPWSGTIPRLALAAIAPGATLLYRTSMARPPGLTLTVASGDSVNLSGQPAYYLSTVEGATIRLSSLQSGDPGYINEPVTYAAGYYYADASLL